MRTDLWIIERRDETGQLLLNDPQPETYFGGGAITGITEDALAKAVFRNFPEALMDGRHIPTWPSIVHPEFIARRKTW